jgi:FixJ family two-component response regulator
MRVPTPSEMVYIVDDDASVRMSLVDLLSSLEIAAASFASAEEFLRCERIECPGRMV